MTVSIATLPKAFVWRRIHSLSGLWLVVFLIEHLITNSQAALLLGDSGKGFVRMVNLIHNLPYLQVIEVTLLGVPFLLHMIWGIQYLLTAKFNVAKKEGKAPSLPLGRNRAYTWQRITSWILVVFVCMHVVKFRFLEYPHVVNAGSLHPTYYVTLSMDPGLYSLSQRLGFEILDAKSLDQMKTDSASSRSQAALWQASSDILAKQDMRYSAQDALILQSAQSLKEKQRLIEVFSFKELKKGQVLATTSQFGTASLLKVRDTFKNPFWVGIYTVFVLSACFHAFNGLWTSLLTWGWVIRVSAQKNALKVCLTLMFLIAFLGLAAVWGTYFFNLKN